MFKIEIGKVYIYKNPLYPGLKYRVQILMLDKSNKFAFVKIVKIFGVHEKISALVGDQIWLRTRLLSRNI